MSELKWIDPSEAKEGQWGWARIEAPTDVYVILVQYADDGFESISTLWKKDQLAAFCPVELPEPPPYTEPRKPVTVVLEWLPYPETPIPDDWNTVWDSLDERPCVPAGWNDREDMSLHEHIKWIAKRS